MGRGRNKNARLTSRYAIGEERTDVRAKSGVVVVKMNDMIVRDWGWWIRTG